MLALIQLHALCSSPTLSISTAIVFARLAVRQREFGPIRAMATLGWMSGCWVVSALNADTTALAGYSGAVIWLVMAAFTFLLRGVGAADIGRTAHVATADRAGRAGVAAKSRPSRRVHHGGAVQHSGGGVVSLHAAASASSWACNTPAAWMSLAQVTEIIAMFALAGLFAQLAVEMDFRRSGSAFGLVRYALCAMNGQAWLLAGISLHGCSFTLVFITAQIYLDERVDAAWRARAQALMALMTSGVGNLIGYLGTGWWFGACKGSAGQHWSLFWGGLAGVVAAVLVYFLMAYHGVGKGILNTDHAATGGELATKSNQ